MEDQRVAEQLLDIQNRLQSISAELAVMKRQREEMQELKNDLTVIAKDVLQTTVEELEDIAPFVRTGDFIHLVKRILRNTNNITAMISKLESFIDFVEDGRPIAKELFNDGLENLDKLDRAGYFEFIKSGKNILDIIVTNLSKEDVELLAESIVPILEIIKSVTKPEILVPLSNAIKTTFNTEEDQIEEYSIWKIMKEMNSPEMKKRIGFAMQLLKNISNEETKQLTEK